MGFTTEEMFMAELAGAPAAVVKVMRDNGTKFSYELKEKIVEHASGRPGPNIVTGEYVSSINVEINNDTESMSINAGSNAPQMMRLEQGYTGTDANGRHVSQPPYPHFRPAFEEMQDRFEELMAHCCDLNVLSHRSDD